MDAFACNIENVGWPGDEANNYLIDYTIDYLIIISSP